MTDQELLNEAKRRFPVNCEYRSTENSLDFIDSTGTWSIAAGIVVFSGHGTSRHLYDNGRWATLISYPSIKFNYLIL